MSHILQMKQIRPGDVILNLTPGVGLEVATVEKGVPHRIDQPPTGVRLTFTTDLAPGRNYLTMDESDTLLVENPGRRRAPAPTYTSPPPDPREVVCPVCIKHLRLRNDDRLPVHNHREFTGQRCEGSGMTMDEAEGERSRQRRQWDQHRYRNYSLQPPANPWARTAAKPLPEGLTMRITSNEVIVTNENPSIVGVLSWMSPSRPGLPGVIHDVWVDPEYQRRGIATTMLDSARESVDYPIIHDPQNMTPDGLAWAMADGRRRQALRSDFTEEQFASAEAAGHAALDLVFNEETTFLDWERTESGLWRTPVAGMDHGHVEIHPAPVEGVWALIYRSDVGGSTRTQHAYGPATKAVEQAEEWALSMMGSDERTRMGLPAFASRMAASRRKRGLEAAWHPVSDEAKGRAWARQQEEMEKGRSDRTQRLIDAYLRDSEAHGRDYAEDIWGDFLRDHGVDTVSLSTTASNLYRTARRPHDESRTKRDEGGKFTSGPDRNRGPQQKQKKQKGPSPAPSGDAKAPKAQEDPKAPANAETGAQGGWEDPQTSGTGTKEDPVRTQNVNDAAAALARGHWVELDQPKKVSTMLDRLAQKVAEAKEAGEDLHIDLCQVTVRDTNLFCTESKGIPRINMPQLKVKGVPEGSRAATEITPTDRGEYDLQPLFLQHLKDEGYAAEETQELAANLRATQNQLNGSKVAGMTDHLLDGGSLGDEPIFVSNDDYIVDGHHRWAANVAADYADGDASDMSMSVWRINVDIITLLDKANKFAKDYGVPTQSVTASRRRPCSDCGPEGMPTFAAAYNKYHPFCSEGCYTAYNTVTVTGWDGGTADECPNCGGPNGVPPAWRKETTMDRSRTASALDDPEWVGNAEPRYYLVDQNLEPLPHGEFPNARGTTEANYGSLMWTRAEADEVLNSGMDRRDTRRPRPRETMPASDYRAVYRDGWYVLLPRTAARTALNDTLAPKPVDTLREESCPVCGDSDSYSGETCMVCGYVAPPAPFREPDVEKAKDVDLRGDQAAQEAPPGAPEPSPGTQVPPDSRGPQRGATNGLERFRV